MENGGGWVGPLRGWPKKRSSVPKEVSEYFNVRDELAVQDGIIFKGQRCVIPKTSRQKVKEKIHRAHIGIQGCLRRAREVVYWPSMNQEITDYIEHCNTCNMYTSHPQREPLVVRTWFAWTPVAESWLWHIHLGWEGLSMYCRLLLWLFWNWPSRPFEVGIKENFAKGLRVCSLWWRCQFLLISIAFGEDRCLRFFSEESARRKERKRGYTFARFLFTATLRHKRLARKKNSKD